MLFWNTYFLLMPYMAILIYFLIFQRDTFFLKTRSSVQLLFVLIVLTLIVLQFIAWKVFFYEYNFLKFNIREVPNKNKIIPLITIIAAVVAMIGWVFTSRVQIINAIKGHTMQVLMNSRTSTIYAEKVDEAMKLRKKLEDEFKEAGLDVKTLKLTKERYLKLHPKERSSVHYLLNFLEFVAVGIRHYTLDEAFIKGSLRTILNSNYRLFHPVIEHLRQTDNPAIYTQIELLYKRWDVAHHEKCAKCNEWDKISDTKISNIQEYKYLMHFLLVIITIGIWGAIVLGMWILESLTDKSNQKSKHVCMPCRTDEKSYTNII